jgi:hypothetical protein
MRLIGSRRKTSASAALMRSQHRHGLGLPVLQRRAQDGGEVAHVLGDQEVMLHEALDLLEAGVLGVAEPHRDLALDVERQPLLRAPHQEVHVAADRPQEVLAAAEQLELVAVEHAALRQLLDLAHAVDVFGDPEQRVQVAQAALAVLDVRLDQVARLSDAAVALLALGQLGGDELRAAALHHRLVELRHQLVVELAVAEQETRLEQRGADRHVGLGLADALAHRARGMADLEAEVPQAIEDRFRHRLAPRRLLVGQQEQEIDVGARRQQPAPVAAGRHDRHALGFRRVVGGIEMLARELVNDADDLILHEAQPLGAAPSLAVMQQQALGGGAPLRERDLEPLHHRRAQFGLAAGAGVGEAFEVGGDGAIVEQFHGAARDKFGRQHAHRIPEAACGVTAGCGFG